VRIFFAKSASSFASISASGTVPAVRRTPSRTDAGARVTKVGLSFLLLKATYFRRLLRAASAAPATSSAVFCPTQAGLRTSASLA